MPLDLLRFEVFAHGKSGTKAIYEAGNAGLGLTCADKGVLIDLPCKVNNLQRHQHVVGMREVHSRMNVIGSKSTVGRREVGIDK